MPIYEFLCEDCGERFEKLLASSADPPPCPRCGSTGVRKEMSIFATGSGTTGRTAACSGGG